MKVSVENKVWVGVGLGFTLLLVASAIACWSVSESIVTFRWVEHTQKILKELDATRAAILDIETGARGFVITGRREFLEPFNAGLGNVNASLQELRTSTADNPVQQKSIAALEPLVAAKISFATNLVYQRETGGFDSAANIANAGAEKATMDAIRAAIDEMESVERNLLVFRSATATRTFHRTVAIVSLSSLLALMVVGVAALKARQDSRRRKLAETERDQFFMLSVDLFCIAGFDGFFKRVNPVWEKTLDYSQEELLSRPFLDFVHPEDRDTTIAETEKIARGLLAISFTNRYRRKDGTYRWFVWNAAPRVERKLIYASARDVTEDRETQQKIELLNENLQRRAHELEQANGELEAFSYSVSHDLRAPLRHIDGFASRLQQGFQNALDEKARRYLNIISDSAKQMGNLIDDLLIFSRMGRTEMHQTTIQPETLINEIIKELQSDVQNRNIDWKVAPLPTVTGDAAMLRQVFINLVSNAVKYTRPREQARIEFGARETPEEFIFFTRDNGVGFEMEYAHKLFGVFQRLHRADEFEGTGIGLANVRRIIHRHGGRTWAEGRLNEGATFYFSLPKKQTTERNHREPAQTHSAR